MATGRCKMDNQECDGESTQCRLNPLDVNATYRDIGDTESHPFPNKKCSNYLKEESV